MMRNVERALMDRGFPELRMKKEPYWPSTSNTEWIHRSQPKDMTGSR